MKTKKLIKEGDTSFFCDTAIWQILKDKVLPDLINALLERRVLRAWVPACSTGEEAYSLAIVFKEALESLALPKKPRLQIFATDLDMDAIEKARDGVFDKSIADDVSPERLKRFFTEEGSGYRVKADLRKMLMFAPQNVIKEDHFTKV